MNKILITTLLLFVAIVVQAQLFDHLEPVDDAFPAQNSAAYKRYYAAELLNGFEQDYTPFLRIVVVPLDSTDLHEYAIEILSDSMATVVKYHKGHTVQQRAGCFSRGRCRLYVSRQVVLLL